MRLLHGGVIPIRSREIGDKVVRLNHVAPLIEAGNVYLPASELHAWGGEIVEELSAFPNGKHDDDVDMVSSGLRRLMPKMLSESAKVALVPAGERAEQGFQELMRRKRERMAGPVRTAAGW